MLYSQSSKFSDEGVSRIERSIIIVKPPSVARDGVTREVMKMIENSGLKIREIRRFTMSHNEAIRLYDEHFGKDFYDWLISQITSGDCVAFLVEGENAAIRVRNLAGPTEPEEARENARDSIRGKLSAPFESFFRSRNECRAVDNVVHTPDPDKIGAVERETRIFFPGYFAY